MRDPGAIGTAPQPHGHPASCAVVGGWRLHSSAGLRRVLQVTDLRSHPSPMPPTGTTATASPSPRHDRGDTEKRAIIMHRLTRRTALSATAVAFLAATSACTRGRQAAAGPSLEPTLPEGWSILPPAPGPARLRALSAWTGTEAVFLGGSPTIPHSGDTWGDSLTATPEDVRHRDGIAFTPGTDPATGTWRTLPEAPVASIDASSGAPTIDGSVYFLAPQGLMQFDTTTDTWTRHDLPAESTGNWLHAAGDHLILTATGFEEIPDFQWNTRTQQWSLVPTDPLGRAGRRAINTPHGFLLIAIDPDYSRDDIGPRPLAAALLDVEAGTWRRLPNYQQLEGGQLTLHGNRVIDAIPLAGFTPAVGPYAGRQLPAAGVLTLPGGAWSTLPGAEEAADLAPG
ncbi:hypothetical protein Krad_2384 [Kineococcus radiotolerans SRS30216 = ATCC BAA-149]|uniref:Uncharacterized protein n=1 Tax=Kineococcus radiotolerans (strain ATCC BAA-149 / DSM 14245 / SRS30216) TaxID=266940 RepID=A6WAM5_KINRD|nr:hypothetical protein Krad_2384 [Kineococcus radiotolerans SRS30216 = ATCC BAA-149]